MAPFSWKGGGEVQVSHIDCQTTRIIEFVDRDFEKESFQFGL